MGKTFDYVVPPGLAPSGREEAVDVGTLVRVGLHGRAVGGWVVAVDLEPPRGVEVQPIRRVSSIGPSPEVVELTEWAAWRWAGRRTAFLRAASPPRMVRTLPSPAAVAGAVSVPASADDRRIALEALAAGQTVLRLAPAGDAFGLIAAAAMNGPVLVVTPSIDSAALLARRMRRAGMPVATVPGGWAQARAGGSSVVGARHAAWAPAPGFAAAIVLDAHDEALVEERAPTWSAWEVVAERARRAAVPCVLVSPCPSLEQLAWGRLVLPERSIERAGWPAIRILDRRGDDPRTGLISEGVVEMVRRATAQRRVLCILNRKGRARLLACAVCRDVAACERCRAGVAQPAPGVLECLNCGRSRPAVCANCGSSRLKLWRLGTSRVREELEALAMQPVGEVTAEADDLPDAHVVVGTEALLHRAAPELVASVVFLDFDAEALAPRFRAGENALALLVRAARLVGGRASRGQVVVQTRSPDHPALVSALRADPSRLAEAEQSVRQTLKLPPVSALALLTGAGAVEFASSLQTAIGSAPETDVIDLGDGRWLLRAADHNVLCDSLARRPRPAGRLRVDVDPLRL